MGFTTHVPIFGGHPVFDELTRSYVLDDGTYEPADAFFDEARAERVDDYQPAGSRRVPRVVPPLAQRQVSVRVAHLRARPLTPRRLPAPDSQPVRTDDAT